MLHEYGIERVTYELDKAVETMQETCGPDDINLRRVLQYKDFVAVNAEQLHGDPTMLYSLAAAATEGRAIAIFV